MPQPSGYPSTLSLTYDLGDGSGAVTASLPWGDGSWCDGVTANIQPRQGERDTFDLLGDGLALGDAGFADQVIYRKSGTQLVADYSGKKDWPYTATFSPIAL